MVTKQNIKETARKYLAEKQNTNRRCMLWYLYGYYEEYDRGKVSFHDVMDVLQEEYGEEDWD